MAARHRLGVVLLLDAPIADEIDGLRRALGDRSLGRIAAHVTLVPPVNVREADVAEALGIVRRAAQGCGRPLTLRLGPPGTFLPANPVLHLPVAGDADVLRRLRDAVFAGPLHRTLAWPWVPHVTLADDADPEAVGAALGTLRRYEVATPVDRVVVLEERSGVAGRRWESYADATLAPAVLVGRGGLDLTLVQGRVVDPAASALLHPSGGDPPPDAGTLEAMGADRARRSDTAPIVITGLVGTGLVGVAVAWRDDGGGRIAVAVAAAHRGSGMGRQLLAHAESAAAAAGWRCPVLRASGPAGFYAACSRWSVAAPA